MSRTKRLVVMACAVAAVLSTAVTEAAQILLPMSPTGKVWVKQVPFFQAMTVEVREGDPFERMNDMNLKLSRFVALQRYEQIKPLALEVPDLAWVPGSGGQVLYFMPMPQDSRLTPPRDEAMNLVEHTSGKVASLSFRGPYEFSVIAPFMKQLADWLKETETVTAGRPRILFYHYRAFRPDTFKCAEIQVPVR